MNERNFGGPTARAVRVVELGYLYPNCSLTHPQQICLLHHVFNPHVEKIMDSTKVVRAKNPFGCGNP